MAKPLNKGKTGANAIITVVAILAAIGLCNVIASRKVVRVDLTADKIYTLSKGSRDLVANLPDILNIKLFMSADLKPPFKNNAQFVRDLLSEYASYSNGKLVFEVIKMGEDAKKEEEEAQRFHVQKSSRGVMSANKVEIGSTYLGVGLDYKGQIESIPVIDTVEGLEFSLSSKIKQLTVKKKKIAFAKSEGESSTEHQGGLQYLDKFLKESGYETQALELKADIPKDVDALMVIGPKSQFKDRAKYVIDQFLMRGKSVAFFVDGQIMEMPRGMAGMNFAMPQVARSNEVALDDLLGHYGFKVKGDMVLDLQTTIGVAQVEGRLLPVTNPAFVAVTDLNPDQEITQGLKVVVFPFTSSVELTGELKDGKGGAKALVLARSSKKSWRPEGPFVFQPTSRTLPAVNDKDPGPFVLAYAAEGKFKSFFAGKQIVKEDDSKVDANVTTPGVEPMVTEVKDRARIAVVADADFINDQYAGLGFQGLQNYIGNVQFALNLVDWLAQDEALAQVRNKGMGQARPLASISEGTVRLIQALNIVGLPLLLCIVGLLRWRIRRGQRAAAALR